MLKKFPKQRRVLVTAGPTREYIDPVRYISNDSSGRMGFALAKAAAHLGCKATLIAGPVGLETPENIRRVDVISAREMLREIMMRAKDFDIIIMAAAVADFTPARSFRNKVKKSPSNAHGLSLSLKRTPDILSWLCRKKRGNQTIVGFALETNGLKKNALKKLRAKNCDWIVANSSRAIGAKASEAILIGRNKKMIRLPRLEKGDLAIVILSHVL